MRLPQQSLWGEQLAAPTRHLTPTSNPVLEPEIREGDAFTLVRELAAKSIDLIITSPPYWGQRTYSGEHNWKILRDWERESDSPETVPPYDWYVKHGGVFGLEPYPHWYVAYLTQFFDLARSALKDGGSVWVNIGDTYFTRWASIREKGRQGLGDNPRERRRVPMGGYRQEKQLLLIPSRFAIAMQDRRWILRNDLIWYKPNVPPRPERDRLRLSHEHFFHFVQRPREGRAKYYYDLGAVERLQNDVVVVNVKAGRDGHSATFPETLIEPRIRSSCPEGGTVLDPFAGTGRALVVAARSHRNAIGFELSADFATAARRAIASLKEI
jgi:site-specific DNA-methyltransferase (cytosine-N4-specific)